MKAAVGRRACWIDGSATAFGLYCQLYRHRDRMVLVPEPTGGAQMHLPGRGVKDQHVPAVQHRRDIDVERAQFVGQEGATRLVVSKEVGIP